ncbi:MAG: hypothetical protein HFI67_07855 [Lachnospiraceae bacterium]|jgi:hypothetical protein|nr:hypothetical protein [Lachnospiraceae bacterium]
METKKVKRYNMGYLLAYIFVPAIVTGVCFFVAYATSAIGPAAVILIMGPSTLSVLWWIFAGRVIFKAKKKKLERELDAQGFVRNHTFNSTGCMVVVDVVNGSIALQFFWNPSESYVLPAARISKTWVNDGRGGKGFMEGSSRVSFFLVVDGVKIRVDTFTSNKRWRMDSEYILTGISKADMMVGVLEEARKKGA